MGAAPGAARGWWHPANDVRAAIAAMAPTTAAALLRCDGSTPRVACRDERPPLAAPVLEHLIRLGLLSEAWHLHADRLRGVRALDLPDRLTDVNVVVP